jgi:hypothetical protein
LDVNVNLTYLRGGLCDSRQLMVAFEQGCEMSNE